MTTPVAQNFTPIHPMFVSGVPTTQPPDRLEKRHLIHSIKLQLNTLYKNHQGFGALSVSQWEARAQSHCQVIMLNFQRISILSTIGFLTGLWQPGYEATPLPNWLSEHKWSQLIYGFGTLGGQVLGEN